MQTTALDLKHHIPKYLKVLDLPHRLFKDIPVELGDLSLERINLENNALANENLAWLERLPIRKSLKYLNLAENKVRFDFPSFPSHAVVCMLETSFSLSFARFVFFDHNCFLFHTFVDIVLIILSLDS